MALSATSARQSTSIWPARRSQAGDAALWASCALLGLGLLALVASGVQEPGARTLLLALLAALLAGAGAGLLVWAVAYRRLTYALTDSALHVQWLGHTTVVPYVAIDGIYTGQRLVGHAAPSVPCWPGIYVGPGRLRGTGRLRFYATSPDPAALTLIAVEHGGIVLSARHPSEFRAALIQRLEESAETPVGPTLPYSTVASGVPWSAVGDRWLWLSGAAGVALLLCVLALIAFGLPAVAEQIPLHFDANGQPSLIGPKSDLLRLPLLGLLLLAVDVALGVFAHARDRLLARLLWVGGAALQLALVVAVVRLLQ